MMDVSDWISVVALLVAAGSFYWSHRFQTQNADRPILVFSSATRRRWLVENVGNGPAIDVLVADRLSTGESLKIVNCAPLSAGATLGVPWLSGRHELVAIYRDVHGRTYTTVCGSNRNKFFRENRYPSMHANRDQWLEDPIWEGRHHTKLRESDLEHLSPLQLLLLRSSIFAKHGYVFPSPDFAAFFSRQSWYQPKEDRLDVVEAKLTVGELAEAQMILGVFYRHPNATRGPFPELLNPGNMTIPPILDHAPPLISAQAAMKTQASVEPTLSDQV